GVLRTNEEGSFRWPRADFQKGNTFMAKTRSTIQVAASRTIATEPKRKVSSRYTQELRQANAGGTNTATIASCPASTPRLKPTSVSASVPPATPRSKSALAKPNP